MEGGFPHGKFPWPFPRHPPKHPHPHPPPHHPHHPFPHPIPNVLGCKKVPTLSEDETSKVVKLDVTIPKWRPILFTAPLLHGNVSVSKIPEGEDLSGQDEWMQVQDWEDLSEGKEVVMHFTVANRTLPKFPPPPPPEDTVDDVEEDVIEIESEEDKGWLLCAVSFTFPHHHPPPPPPEDLPGEYALMHHPHHRRPHPPPVIVSIFVSVALSLRFLKSH
jgi:hypothetical protein